LTLPVLLIKAQPLRYSAILHGPFFALLALEETLIPTFPPGPDDLHCILLALVLISCGLRRIHNKLETWIQDKNTDSKCLGVYERNKSQQIEDV
jgi:hypothetical protein